MIALVDMNAFFASIEQLDHPQWRGLPLCVTNGATGTCIITASYEARALGIKTGMRLREARKLAPGLIQAPSRPHRYAEVSSGIMASLEQITPDVEVFSVDEAFLDLTACQALFDVSVEAVGERIKAVVMDVSGLTCSVGISGDRTTAKWAAGQQKPDGLTIVAPDQVRQRLADVPVTELCGIGPGIARYLAEYGVLRCADMQGVPISVLAARFGNVGRRIWLMAQGLDPEPVRKVIKPPVTIGHGKVIPPNTRDRRVLRIYFLHMCEKVAARMRRHGFRSRRFTVGVNTNRGWQGERLKTALPTADGEQIMELIDLFLNAFWNGDGVFQVHVGAQSLQSGRGQVELFDSTSPRREKLLATVDAVNRRFGDFTLCKALLLDRSAMPDVIAPAWRPDGVRNTISPLCR